MHEVILVRSLRARALPKFPAFFAQPFRHVHKLALTNAAATATVVATRKCRLPNLAGLHPLNTLDDARLAAALITHLHLALVFLRRGHDQLRLTRILAGRLLHVHMLTCFHCQNSHRRMPEVRRGNRYHIN